MNLNDTLHGYDESLAKVPSDMPGEIGAVINGKRRTNVVGRGGFVYVRLRTNLSEPIQAYNDRVFPGFGVAVIVRWVNNRYEVIGRDSQRYQEWEADTPEIAKHGSSHSLDVEGNNIGTDPVWVYPYQVIPGLVSPYSQSGAQNVYVHPFPILYGGEWMYVGNTGTPSLTAYSPASGTVLVLIAMDAETGNPALFASTGSYISWNISGSNSLVPNLPYLDTVRYLPLSFAILQSGTTSMSWNNLRDLRQWMSTSQSGTGGGVSLEFQDEGVPLGIPGTVNFVGGNVSVTISGTVARVFVTGSSGGTSDHNSLTGLQGGTGSQYYHLGYNEWGGLVTGSLTYLHKHSAVDIVTGTVATARLGSGTASATTALHGDQTYKTVREVLTTSRTYYVRTDGNDSNDGLANTAGGAFLTIQKALDVAAALDSSIYDVTISVADGTYTENLICKGLLGTGILYITGNTTTPANCIIAGGSGIVLWIYGTKSRIEPAGFKTTGSSYGILAQGACVVILGAWNHATTGVAQIYMDTGAAVTLNANYTISAGAARHFWIFVGGYLQISSKTVTVSGTPAFSSAFVDCNLHGTITAYSITFSGSATGKRYNVTKNGVIDTNGGGANYFPGNSAGTTATGGQYI